MRPRIRGSILALAMAIASRATPLHAMAPPLDFEQRIIEADDHASHGQHAEALRAYSEALAAMPSELKAGSVGEFVAMAAGKAALDEFEASGDREALAAGRVVLLTFVGAATGAGGSTDGARLDGVRQLLARIDASLPSTSARAAPPPPPDAIEPEPLHDEHAAAADGSAHDRKLVIGLAIPGGVAMLTGVVLTIAGARQVSYAEVNLEALGYGPRDDQYGITIADAKRARNIDVGLGVGFMVAGAGLIATALVLARGKPEQRQRVACLPVLGRDRALLGATLRF